MVTAERVVLRSQASSGWVSPPSEHALQAGGTATPKAAVRSVSRRSAHDRTVPPKVTSPLGLPVMRSVTPFTPRRYRAQLSADRRR
jgi:hypothetical protein